MIPYMERLPESTHGSFKGRILELLKEHWNSEPVYFPFRRILFSATKK
jgi:trans-aconitate 2-methyltransferase